MESEPRIRKPAKQFNGAEVPKVNKRNKKAISENAKSANLKTKNIAKPSIKNKTTASVPSKCGYIRRNGNNLFKWV